ncbi:MAG TPA: type II secretion system F family protein [Tepidisphaeraceae bacterium]|nr:type II secretion system F family protein [Tepidisphaeraceae bacterium]
MSIEPQTVFLAGSGVSATLLVFAVSRMFVGGDQQRQVKRRMAQSVSRDEATPRAERRDAPTSLLTRMTAAAAAPLQPRSEKDQSALKQRLGYAGQYAPAAARVLVGAKLLLLLAGVVAGYFIALAMEEPYPKSLAIPALLAAFGMMAPEMWLSYMIRREHTRLEHALPDALDLLVVCVESGLTMDAALQRVSKEVALAHPSLARELAITHIETQMGVPRSEAMRKLADRTGSKSLKSLTAMLIQAERFGTSIAGALRVYSESLRVKRQFQAQEMAARASVKLTFPLVFCIFPSLLTVAAGPALIQIMRTMHAW